MTSRNTVVGASTSVATGTRWRSAHRGQVIILVGAASLVVVSAVWARRVNVHLGTAAPLLGQLQLRGGLLTVPAVAMGAAAVATAPALTRRLPFGALLAITWIAAAAWALALAGIDGAAGITHPLSTSDEYLPDLRHVRGLSDYVAGFTAHIHDPAPGQFLWSVHVAGGPPGPLLIFALLARIGLGGSLSASLLVILVGASAAPATVLAARHLQDEQSARTIAPFLAFAPVAIWLATSADALFLGLSAWGVALLIVAARHDRHADAVAVLGGLISGLALYCSYGVAPLGAVAAAIALGMRRIRPLLVAAVGVLAVAATFLALGFWWWTGLSATRVRYSEGLASMRPYGYFLLADIAAFAVAVGPAAVAALPVLPRRSRLWWPVSGTLLAVAVADLSGLSKGEVERIWLPFAPWILVATAALGTGRHTRAWLAVQIAFALTLQSLLVGNW